MPQYIYIYTVIIRRHKNGSAWRTKYYNEGRYIQMNMFRQFYVLEIDVQACEFAFKQSCTMAQRTEGTLSCNKQNGHLAFCFCQRMRNFAFQLRCMDHFHFENHVRLTIGAPHRIVQTCVMFETF